MNRKKAKVYGQELIINLYDCEPEILRSKKKIIAYLNQLCRLLKTRKYGKPIVKRFGFNKDFTTGFSFVQLIETSSITGHLCEVWNRVFINIFSCKMFAAKRAADFTKRFFKAKRIKTKNLSR